MSWLELIRPKSSQHIRVSRTAEGLSKFFLTQGACSREFPYLSLKVSPTLYLVAPWGSNQNSQARVKTPKTCDIGRTSSPGFPNCRTLPHKPGTISKILFIRVLGAGGWHGNLSRLLEGTRTAFGDGGLTTPKMEAYLRTGSNHSEKKIFVTSKGSVWECVVGGCSLASDPELNTVEIFEHQGQLELIV